MLDKIGIMTWQARGRYLIWLDPKEAPHGRAHLQKEKKQLLDRMLQALQWPTEETTVLLLESTDYFLENMLSFRPAKMLLFDVKSKDIPEAIHYVQLPSLEKLLNDVDAKRQAWKEMQSKLLL